MYLAIKGCEFRFEVFELLFLLPRAVHDLLQNRNLLGYLFRVSLKLLNQAVYLLQGVQEVHAGELRVCRNPAVVVAVLHSAFSRHEELVLRKVEKEDLLRMNACRSLSKPAIFFSNFAFSNKSVFPERMATYSEKKSPFLGIVYTGK